MMRNSLCEFLKTISLVIIALITFLCWTLFKPHIPNLVPEEKIGTVLFEYFNDPAKMTRIEFEKIDPTNGKLQSLTLIREKDEWKLPALSNFPVENAERVSKIVASLMQLTILDVSKNIVENSNSEAVASFHRECGLLNPENYDLDFVFEKQESSSGDVDNNSSSNAYADKISKETGLLVKIYDESNETLVNLLVGNRVPESSATRDARFVRFPNDNVVYTVDFSGDSLQEAGTTEFVEFPNRISFSPQDWIDPDLLRISRWDVLFAKILNYSFALDSDDSQYKMLDLKFPSIAIFKQNPDNSLSNLWSLEKLMESSQQGDWCQVNVDVKELTVDNDMLNNTIDGICNLRVVDVRRKTNNLIDLFKNKRWGTELSTQTIPLGSYGFSMLDRDPLNLQNEEPFLVGEGGSVELITKDGIKIVIVFGKKFDDMRACIAYADFDRDTLALSTSDSSELDFLAPNIIKKVTLKNTRLANWFYLISEEKYQALRLNSDEFVHKVTEK